MFYLFLFLRVQVPFQNKWRKETDGELANNIYLETMVKMELVIVVCSLLNSHLFVD